MMKINIQNYVLKNVATKEHQSLDLLHLLIAMVTSQVGMK